MRPYAAKGEVCVENQIIVNKSYVYVRYDTFKCMQESGGRYE